MSNHQNSHHHEKNKKEGSVSVDQSIKSSKKSDNLGEFIDFEEIDE